MNLDQYPTPLTDKAGFRIFEVSADFERKLAAAKEALETVVATETESCGGADFLDRIFPALESARAVLASLSPQNGQETENNH